MTALNVATQVAGMMLHCATIEKFVATLQEMFPKVELISSSRNDRGNKKNFKEWLWQGMLHWAIFLAACVVTKLRDKLHEKLPSVS